MAGAASPPSPGARRFPRLAPLLLIAGALLLLLGGALFLGGYKGLWSPDTLQRQPLLLGQSTPLKVALEPGQPFILAVTIKLAPAKEGAPLRYRFPLEYSVRGSDGKLLSRRHELVAWNQGQRTARQERGMTLVEHRITALVAPPSGVLNITLQLDPDIRYQAIATEVTARIEEGERAGLGWAFSIFTLVVAGALLLMAGATLLALRSEAPPTSFDGALAQIAANERGMQNWAMFTHLSPLCLYLGLPFGHLLAPLTLWLLKRKESPLLAREGKEVLNFQLSVTLYALLCILLSVLFIGLLLLLALAIGHLIFTIVAAVRVSEGRHYRYPLTIRFIK